MFPQVMKRKLTLPSLNFGNLFSSSHPDTWSTGEEKQAECMVQHNYGDIKVIIYIGLSLLVVRSILNVWVQNFSKNIVITVIKCIRDPVWQKGTYSRKYMCSLNNMYLKFSITYYNSVTFIKLSINFYVSGKNFK